MDEEKKKVLQKFKEDVAWLKQNIGQDDIYEFAQQALTGASYFIHKWSEWVDIEDEVDKDKVTAAWIKNIIGVIVQRELRLPTSIDTDFKNLEDL